MFGRNAVIVLCSLALCAGLVLAQEQAPAAATYKKLNITGFDDYQGPDCWIVSGSKTSFIVSAQRYDLNIKPHTIHTIPVTTSGTSGATKTIFDKDFRSLVSGVDAIWVDKVKVSASAKTKPFALVLISYMRGMQFYTHDPYDPEIVFAYAKLDANGNRVSDFVELYSEKVPTGAQGSNVVFKAYAQQTEDKIAVIIMIQYYGLVQTKAFFTLLDVADLSKTGTSAAELTAVKLPGGGTGAYYIFDKPVWNGGLWLAPAYWAAPNEVGTSLGVLRILPKPKKNKIKTKLIKLVGYAKNTFYLDTYMLPATTSSSPAKISGENTTLMYRKFDYVKQEYTGPFLQQLNVKGKKVGTPWQLILPTWKMTLKKNKSLQYQHQGDQMSEPFQVVDGKIYFGRCQSYWQADKNPDYSPKMGEYDSQIDTIQLDLEKKSMAVYGSDNVRDTSYFMRQFFGWFNSKLSVVLKSRIKGRTYQSYFTSF